MTSKVSCDVCNTALGHLSLVYRCMVCDLYYCLTCTCDKNILCTYCSSYLIDETLFVESDQSSPHQPIVQTSPLPSPLSTSSLSSLNEFESELESWKFFEPDPPVQLQQQPPYYSSNNDMLIPLPNLGNSCYINSVMQLFIHSGELLNALYNSLNCSQRNIFELVKQARLMYCKESNIALVDQCDTFLFLTFLLDKLTNYKLLFEQNWMTLSKCTECQTKTKVFQKENVWILYPTESSQTDKQYTLADCVDHQVRQYFEKKCEVCNKKTRFRQTLLLVNDEDCELPSNFFINLQYFQGKHLEIFDCFGIQTTTKDLSCKSEVNFDLRGFIVHKGTQNFGHYMAYCYIDKDEQWYCLNDSSITPCYDINRVLNSVSSFVSIPLLWYRKDTNEDDTN